MRLAVTVKIQAVGPIIVGLMSLDDMFDEMGLNILPAKKVAYRSQIREFHV